MRRYAKVYENNAGISPLEGPTAIPKQVARSRYAADWNYRLRRCARVCTETPHRTVPLSPRNPPKSSSLHLTTHDQTTLFHLLLLLLLLFYESPAATPCPPFTLPYCKFHGPCIKLWSCPGIDPTQPAHLPSGYAARAHIRYVHF